MQAALQEPICAFSTKFVRRGQRTEQTREDLEVTIFEALFIPRYERSTSRCKWIRFATAREAIEEAPRCEVNLIPILPLASAFTHASTFLSLAMLGFPLHHTSSVPHKRSSYIQHLADMLLVLEMMPRAIGACVHSSRTQLPRPRMQRLILIRVDARIPLSVRNCSISKKASNVTMPDILVRWVLSLSLSALCSVSMFVPTDTPSNTSSSSMRKQD